MTNIAVGTIISARTLRYVPGDMVGLPVWTRTELYDVKATSFCHVPRPTIG